MILLASARRRNNHRRKRRAATAAAAGGMNFRHLRQQRRGDTFGERNLKNADGGEEGGQAGRVTGEGARENTYDESGAKKRRRRSIGI